MVEFRRSGFTISTDPARLDLTAIHGFLSKEAYWSTNIPIDILERAVKQSLCFGVYQDSPTERQVGFARVISDYATFAYLCDVFVISEFQGEGLGKWLIECITTYPELQGLRRWMLATRDAHGLYEKYGFSPLAKPERWMEIVKANIYNR